MKGFDGVDYAVCYQSKVGSLKWLDPTLDNELLKVAAKLRPVVIVPNSFVSEHSETLVELDIDYKQKAASLGIPFYGRIPALSEHPLYIKCLANAVRNLVDVNREQSSKAE
jgi:protoporphyrin/coproporphyrin ferrochelatase